MNQNLIYFPCMAMMILTLTVLLRMFATRVRAVRNGSVDIRYFKTYDMDCTKSPLMVQAARNFTNLFEVPTLFYMICVFALVTQNVSAGILSAAWIYVALRVAHSFIHTTNNKIILRMNIYGLSWVVLLYMGLSLGYKIFLQMA